MSVALSRYDERIEPSTGAPAIPRYIPSVTKIPRLFEALIVGLERSGYPHPNSWEAYFGSLKIDRRQRSWKGASHARTAEGAVMLNPNNITGAYLPLWPLNLSFRVARRRLLQTERSPTGSDAGVARECRGCYRFFLQGLAPQLSLKKWPIFKSLRGPRL